MIDSPTPGRTNLMPRGTSPTEHHRVLQEMALQHDRHLQAFKSTRESLTNIGRDIESLERRTDERFEETGERLEGIRDKLDDIKGDIKELRLKMVGQEEQRRGELDKYTARASVISAIGAAVVTGALTIAAQYLMSMKEPPSMPIHTTSELREFERLRDNRPK